MKKITGLLIFILLIQYHSAIAQSFAINTSGAAAHASAILDVTSINKGLLIPRLTTAQRTSIASPGKGLLVYDSTLKSFYFHDGVNWQQINADSNNLWRKNGNDIYNSNTGNVGIGVSSPKSLLNVRGGAILFDSTIGGTPVSGAGTRMMWIPAKGAFRAGTVSGTHWNDANIGNWSVAFGKDCVADGDYCFAMGLGTTATYAYSTSVGYLSYAGGFGSFSAGGQATGMLSASFGSGRSMGTYSLAAGSEVYSKSYAGTAVGAYNDLTAAGSSTLINPLNRLFEIGNGTAYNVTSNAMTVLQNGNVGIGTTTPAYMLTIKKDINVDNENANAGSTTNTLKFGGNGTGESIGSNRTTAVNQWGLDFYTNFINRMIIGNNGNIGIGTTLPTSKLDVNGQLTIDQKNFGGFAGLLIKGNSPVSNYPNIGFSTQNTAANDVISAIIGGTITNNTAGTEAMDLGFYTSTTGQAGLSPRLLIKDNGNVGIGTINPNAKLNITGSETSGNGLGVALQLTNTASANSWTLRAGATGTNTPAGGFSIGDNAAYRLVITNAGNVGIGTTTPAAMLDVVGNAAVSTNLTVQSGMGIIRNISGIQLKKLSIAVTVNHSFTATEMTNVPVNWPQAFSIGNIEAFVGNITSQCCSYAPILMSLSDVTTTGASLNVYNTLNIPWYAFYTVNIIAIGPQ